MLMGNWQLSLLVYGWKYGFLCLLKKDPDQGLVAPVY